MPGRGRPQRYGEPQISTTVRLPLSEWQWVKNHPAVELSSLMHAKVRELMDREAVRSVATTDDPKVEALKAWLGERNRKGLATSPIELANKRQELGIFSGA